MKARNIRYVGNKYGAERCQMDGKWFDSRLEASHYLRLKDDLRLKRIRAFEHHVLFELFAWTPDGKRKQVGLYESDFYVTKLDWTKRVDETKGLMTDVARIKIHLFIANYPDIEFKLIKFGQKPQPMKGYRAAVVDLDADLKTETEAGENEDR